MKISVVIPCYNSEKSIRTVVEEMRKEISEMGYTYEFVLVNDNSKDNTSGEIAALAGEDKNVKAIDLMKNFGQHNALMCALNYAEGDYVLGMDDDLQTQPSESRKLIKEITEGDYDAVYGVYAVRKNGKVKNFTSFLNEISSRVLLGKPKGIHSSNYWIITDSLRRQIISYRGHNPNIDGLIFSSTKNIGNVTIEHHKRVYGKSNYTFRKLVRLWITYFNFSFIPLRIATVTGSLMALIGMISGVVILISKLINPSTVAGWASIVCILLVFFGIVLLVLGMMGEYVGGILKTVNNSPQYIVRKEINTGNDGE